MVSPRLPKMSVGVDWKIYKAVYNNIANHLSSGKTGLGGKIHVLRCGTNSNSMMW